MVEKIQLKALYNFISIFIFFISFFSNYIIYSASIVEAFLKSFIAMLLSNVVLRIIYFVWFIAFSPKEWKLIIEGPQEVDVDKKEPKGSQETQTQEN